MKRIFKNILALIIVGTTLTSCLKDDTAVLDPEKAGSNLVEFINPAVINVAGSSIPLYVMSYPIQATAQSVPIEISYSGAETEAPQDIVVNFAVGSQALIDKYNTEQNTAYLMMPSSWYSIGATSVTIPKGQKRASFNVSINSSLFDLTKPYVVPLEITSVSSGSVSANFGKILLNLGAKNPYDGLYNYKTSANTSLVPNANRNNIALITTGPNTVRISPGLLATYSNEVTYTVNPTTFAVTVTCPSLGVQTPQDTRSKWDPATKTMTVFWKQGNGGRTFEEVFTYLGVR